jgi:hypothetical protein
MADLTEAVYRVSEIMVAYAKKLVADIPAERMCEQPASGMNHPLWILGHLTFSLDRMAKMLGAESHVDQDWADVFSPGTRPSTDVSRYPSKDDVLAAFEAARQRLVTAVKQTPDEVLAREFPHEQFRSLLPTIGIAVTQVLTAHLGMHLGQLSAWRRAAGMKHV